jgi:hypothetical protein
MNIGEIMTEFTCDGCYMVFDVYDGYPTEDGDYCEDCYDEL